MIQSMLFRTRIITVSKGESALFLVPGPTSLLMSLLQQSVVFPDVIVNISERLLACKAAVCKVE